MNPVHQQTRGEIFSIPKEEENPPLNTDLPAEILPWERFRKQVQRAAGEGNREKFQKLLEKIPSLHHSFSRHPTAIQKYYQQAMEVYEELSDRTKLLFVSFVDLMTSNLTSELPCDPEKGCIAIYQKKWEEIFASFTKNDTDIRTLQKTASEGLLALFSMFFEEDIPYLLDDPPCGYEMRVSGELAREEIGPYPDIEYFLLIEEKKHLPYFENLADIFRGQFPFLKGTFQHRIFSLLDLQSLEDPKVYTKVSSSRLIYGNGTFFLPKPDFSEVLPPFREDDLNRILGRNVLLGEVCDLELELLEPLSHSLQHLGSLFGFAGENTLDLIEKIPLLKKPSRHLLQKIFEEVYLLYIETQLGNSDGSALIALTPSLKHPVATDEQRDLLKHTQFLLDSLIQVDPQNLEIDLFDFSTIPPTKKSVRYVGKLLRDAPFEVHKKYYQKLRTPDQVALRREYLLAVPLHAEKLSSIPNDAGYRLSYEGEEEILSQRLQEITTDDSTSGVKITTPLLGERYLTQEAVATLMDNKGHIRRAYKNSLHAVNRVRGVHVKELPYQPMMEYAIHSLTSRIVGKASPATTLGQIVNLKYNLSYPVLFSETIEGEELDATKPLDLDHLTWLCLCEILTKPGDGRASNYLISKGKVYCVDNDIGFVEPIYKRKGKRKIGFTSALFTLDFPLSQTVLQQFSLLNPDLILKEWMKELEEQEKRYLSLFPDIDALKKLYTKEKALRFTPSLLFPKGTIATLCIQFYHLQNFVKQGDLESPQALLQTLIRLEGSEKTPMGGYIEKEYSKTLGLPFRERLRAATAAKNDRSITSQQALQLSYRKIPTFEEIQETKVYSLEKAYEELCILQVQQFWNVATITNTGGEWSLEIDFSSLDDIEREKQVLEGLHFLFQREKQKPSSLTLRHAKVLTKQHLAELLHSGLRTLDLSFWSGFSEDCLSLIQRRVPQLQSLALEGTRELKNCRLELSELRYLNLNRCSQLSTITLLCPKLEELHSHVCKSLKGSSLYLLAKSFLEGEGVRKNSELGLSFLDKAAGSDDPEVIYQAGRHFVDGDGVDQDHNRAEEYWERAASLKHPIAKMILQWVNYWEGEAGGGRRPKLRMEHKISDFHQMKDHELLPLLQAIKITKFKELKENIILENHKIGDQGAATIADFLKKDQHAMAINLSENRITAKGVGYLAKALEVNTTLLSLNLSENKLDEQAVSYLANLLRGNSSLQSLHLYFCNIHDPGLRDLAEALKRNRSLIHLNFTSNMVTDHGLFTLLEALETNTTLTSLELWGCGYISFLGFARLFEFLRSNQTLEKVKTHFPYHPNLNVTKALEILHENQLTLNYSFDFKTVNDVLAALVADTVRENKTLRSLQLTPIVLREEGAEFLLQAFKDNRTLTDSYWTTCPDLDRKQPFWEKEIEKIISENKARLEQASLATNDREAV